MRVWFACLRLCGVRPVLKIAAPVSIHTPPFIEYPKRLTFKFWWET
jgi:hypothetical protein